MSGKSDYLEGQSKRKNLIIDGIPESPGESWEESEYKVRELLRTELQMDEERIEVERAHRMGNGRGADKPRQIVVKFLRFKDKTVVMGRRNRLKGTNIFLNEDYPEAVRQKRKELVPAMKAERSKGNIAYIRACHIDGQPFGTVLLTLLNASGIPADIYKVSEDITVNEGSNLTLSCLASGRPDPAINWRLLNPSAEPLDGEEYLDIIGIMRNQAGRYECKASNDVATPDVKYVNVVVSYPPTIKKTQSSETPVGRMGTLQCDATAVPTPEFEWYRDEK
ncbi:hypothetical protein JOQ06_017049, partial [Pogonophryne albipinna]